MYKRQVQALLKRIGVDGVRYEEFFITSFDGDVLGLYDYLTEYELSLIHISAKQAKSSIRAQLKAAKEQAPKKQARQKTQDLERS